MWDFGLDIDWREKRELFWRYDMRIIWENVENYLRKMFWELFNKSWILREYYWDYFKKKLIYLRNVNSVSNVRYF